MNDKYKAMLLGLLALAMASVPAARVSASSLSGRILLQVEKGGQAWYVDPVSDKRAFLGRPADAFNVMRAFGLGISNDNLRQLRMSTAKRQKLSGRILLQVENGGAAFYVNPSDLTLDYLGRPADAFALMRSLALGISNSDLAKIPLDKRYPDTAVTNTVNTSTTASAATSTATITPIVSNGQTIAANTCTSWEYSDWHPCTIYGNQTREIAASYPSGCAGGNAILEQACGAGMASSTDIVASSTQSAIPTLDDLLLSAAYLDNGKNVGLSCKPWMNKLVSFVTNGLLVLPSLQPDNYTWGLNNNNRVLYRSTAVENVRRADIIQYNVASQHDLPHTMMVVSRTQTGLFVIHSNWRKANTVSVDFITFAYFNSAAGTQYSVYHIY